MLKDAIAFARPTPLNTTVPPGPATVMVSNGSWRATTWPLPSVATQPLVQSPALGVSVMEMLRLIASLLASTRPAKTSKLAVFTRWLRIMSRMLGTASAVRMPTMSTTIIISTIVKPALRILMASPARVAGTGLLSRAVDGEVAVGRLLVDGRGGDDVGGRNRGRTLGHREGVELRQVRGRPGIERRDGARIDRVLARVEQVLLLLVGELHHEALRLGPAALAQLVLVAGPGDGRQDADDGHHHHDLDQREAARTFHRHFFSLVDGKYRHPGRRPRLADERPEKPGRTVRPGDGR